MIIHIIRGVEVCVQNVTNIKIKTGMIPKIYNHKYMLTYDYFEPLKPPSLIPVFSVNFGLVSVGLLPKSVINLNKTYEIFGDDYEELQQIKKEIENKQEFMRVKYKEANIEYGKEYEKWRETILIERAN